jgi:hypothetical protein
VIRRGPWKLLYFYEDRHLELYHLERDLGENDNQAAAQPKRARELAEELTRWLRATEALVPSEKDTGKFAALPDGTTYEQPSGENE